MAVCTVNKTGHYSENTVLAQIGYDFKPGAKIISLRTLISFKFDALTPSLKCECII